MPLLRVGLIVLRLNNRQLKAQVHAFGLIEAEQLLRSLPASLLIGVGATSNRARNGGVLINQFIPFGHNHSTPVGLHRTGRADW